MIKITYKMKDGTYKSKIIEEHELPEVKKKFLNSKSHEYWWQERVYGKDKNGRMETNKGISRL